MTPFVGNLDPVPRSAVQGAIQYAIDATDGLGAQEIADLHDVGRNRTRLAIGTYYNATHGCGCPSTEAGITAADGTLLKQVPPRVAAFARYFDQEIYRLTGVGFGVVTVVG